MALCLLLSYGLCYHGLQLTVYMRIAVLNAKNELQFCLCRLQWVKLSLKWNMRADVIVMLLRFRDLVKSKLIRNFFRRFPPLTLSRRESQSSLRTGSGMHLRHQTMYQRNKRKEKDLTGNRQRARRTCWSRDLIGSRIDQSQRALPITVTAVFRDSSLEVTEMATCLKRCHIVPFLENSLASYSHSFIQSLRGRPHII